jgi:hypothetical protein
MSAEITQEMIDKPETHCERWKWIKGYEGVYQISNWGRFKSFYNHNHPVCDVGHIMELYPKLNGYFYADLKINGKRKECLISRLVAKHFIPNPDNKPCINHKDGVKANNHYSNLEWVTHSENNLHSHRILGNTSGDFPRGEDHPHAKLTWEIVREIRRTFNKEKITFVELAKKYGVDNTTISAVIKHKNWKDKEEAIDPESCRQLALI